MSELLPETLVLLKAAFSGRALTDACETVKKRPANVSEKAARDALIHCLIHPHLGGLLRQLVTCEACYTLVGQVVDDARAYAREQGKKN